MVVTRRVWWPAGAVILAVAAVAGLCWASVGDNTDARFLLPAVALFPALLPLAGRADGRENGAPHAYGGVAPACVIIPLARQRQTDVPLLWGVVPTLHGEAR